MSKGKKNEKVEEQLQDVKPEATVESPADTTTAPADGEGFEAVTVIILDYTGHGNITAETVKANLVGTDCEIRIVKTKDTQVKTLLAELPEVETERIILMDDQQLLLTPISIYDIGVKKFRKTGNSIVPETRMPVLMHKSVLQPLLESLDIDAPDAEVAAAYLGSINLSVTPIVLDDWRNDPWLLPIVSEKPNVEVLRNWTAKKKFAWIKQWTPDIEKIVADE